MAKGIFNRPYMDGSPELAKRLFVRHIKECLDVEGYTNGTQKALKIDKAQAAYLRGIYEALDLLTKMWIKLKNDGCDGVSITNLLGDEHFPDYIIDRFTYYQKLFPATYKEWYDDAVENDDLVDVNFY